MTAAALHEEGQDKKVGRDLDHHLDQKGWNHDSEVQKRPFLLYLYVGERDVFY
jgi:hypothetical protein